MGIFLPDKRAWRGPITLLARAMLGWLLACLCAAAAAQDHITARAYWEEPCSRHTLDEARRQDFTAYTGMLARDYSPCAVWVRLRIDPGAAPPDASAGSPTPLQRQPLVLRMLPSYLDEIELFDPLAAGGGPRLIGDRHRPAAGEYRSLALQFSIPAGDAPRDIWLRIASTSTRMLDVQALPLAQAFDSDRMRELAYSGYLALLVVTLLWALFHWLQWRERVIGVFVFKHLLTLAWSVLLLGYGRTLLGDAAPPGLIDTLTSLLVLVIVPASIWFDCTLLREYHPPRIGIRWLPRLALGCLLVELLLMAAGQAWLALRLNALTIVFVVWVIFVLTLLSRPSLRVEVPVLPKWWLVILYGVIAVVITVTVLTHLAVIAGNRLVLASVFVHGLLTGVAMVALLSVRARRLMNRQEEMRTQLALARRLVQHERLHREEQEKLLDMLTHELKTPLAVVRMLLGIGVPSPSQVGKIRRALTEMNEVIERCAQTEQLHGGRLQAQLAPCDVAAELGEFASQWQASQRFDLRIELPPEMVTLHTDARLLRIIVANLLDNACKYSPIDSTVTARLMPCARTESPEPRSGPSYESARHFRQGLAIEIENLPGPAGWPDPARVFDRYYRSPLAHRQTGSGLGLYLVAGLTNLLDGAISYRPTETHIRFRLWLPA